MAIRSLKLKLSTSKESDLSLRQALWQTHRSFNEGVEYYMNFLVMFRQQDLGTKLASEIQMDLMKHVRNQQIKNGAADLPGKDDHIMLLLRQLYTLIVPSSVGKSGDAQSLAKQFLSPLVDPNSIGGLGKAKSGNKPRWKRLKEAGDPAWEQAYERYMEDKKENPTASILTELAELGLKPLLPLYTDQTKDIQWAPKSARQYVRTWDRDMFQQAIERLLSWESWNRRVGDEYKTLSEKIDTFSSEKIDTSSDWYQGLRKIEERMKEEVEMHGFTPLDEVLITKRQVRGWNRIAEKWIKLAEDADTVVYWSVVSEVQTSMRGQFGSARLYQLLMEPENRHIWRDDPSRLLTLAAYNGLRFRLHKAKQQATFTLPDPIHHPLWVRFEGRGGTNIHSYELDCDKDGNLFVTFDSLLWPSENGIFFEKEKICIPIKYSIQWAKQVQLTGNPKNKQEVKFYDQSSKVEMKGTVGGSKIQFDRKYLKHRGDRAAWGKTGPVFINISIDVEPYIPSRNGRPQTPQTRALTIKTPPNNHPRVKELKINELHELLGKGDTAVLKGHESLTAGMRVMSIDMGLRTAASVSVFELTGNKPNEGAKSSKLFFEVPGTSLYAVHQRSFLLQLPGEETDSEMLKMRELKRKERRLIRNQVELLSHILRLHTKNSSEDRVKALSDFVESISGNHLFSDADKDIWISTIRSLQEYADVEKELWEEHLIRVHREIERHVAYNLKQWRKSLSKNRKGIAGLSFWNLEDLDETRKLMAKWHNRARQPGEVRRFRKDETFASKRLLHFQNLKEDRLKQMANLIVMTALGYKYEETTKEWVAAYPACQLILFEDLSRYLFKQDRAPRENSDLMKWAHRSIPNMVYQQGELFGLMIGYVHPEYSSRFHAKTGAPGIRCHALTEDDFPIDENGNKTLGWRIQQLIRSEFVTEEQAYQLRSGDIVPWSGGELFVTRKSRNRDDLVVIHADINAAQNLQKRFWTQSNDHFRVVGKRISMGGITAYIPKNKKIADKLGKGAFFTVDDKEGEVYVWEKSTKLKNKITSSEQESDVDLDEFEQTLEEAGEMSGEYKTLFRDPSGHFFHPNEWRPQKDFWGRIHKLIGASLRGKILARMEVQSRR